ncbi:ROK family protein [Candidatus Halobonum tyrrellensis]|uniref:ROK family protein n=1 Tax=Candidatus Halobonum tyrrellensis G22 TaxID=1324957 RepID=V4HIH3_9EURY|nr:ROK family protein [Candidatus Halobonum tyrrellensis]ESP87724.1 ROK family protein [Candidatus Halobonum tyrrellensis G22]
MASYVGVDLGATNVRAVVGDERAQIRGRAASSTPEGPTGIDVTEAVLDVTRAACDDAGVDPETVAAAGVASIGPLDLAEGLIDGPANFPDSVGQVPLTGPLSELLGTDEVHLHNDTVAGVIGERFHSDRNPDDMVYLTISSGIGAGVCVDGNVLEGWDGNAGEVGHDIVDPAGAMTCGCGRDGHWEAYCSGDNIPRYARHLHEAESVDTDLPVGDDGFGAPEVFDARGDDPLADLTLDRVRQWNLIGMTNLVHSYAPLVVFVGGSVALHNPEEVVDPLRDGLAESVFTNVPDIQLTTMGDDVVVKGALASALTDGTGDRSQMQA